MFSWFRSAPICCPIPENDRDWIDAQWSWMEDTFGADFPKNGDVILPRLTYFPDPFKNDLPSAQRMLVRCSRYMDVDPETVEVQFYTHACPALAWDQWGVGDDGNWYSQSDRTCLWVEQTDMDDPLGFAAKLTRELAYIQLMQHRVHPENFEDFLLLAELLTVYFGMGVLTANAVILENNWTEGQISGWRMQRASHLDMEHYGYALARFALARRGLPRKWPTELRLDVRTHYDRALRFLEAEARPTTGRQGSLVQRIPDRSLRPN